MSKGATAGTIQGSSKEKVRNLPKAKEMEHREKRSFELTVCRKGACK